MVSIIIINNTAANSIVSRAIRSQGSNMVISTLDIEIIVDCMLLLIVININSKVVDTMTTLVNFNSNSDFGCIIG